jgi:urate oxidase
MREAEAHLGRHSYGKDGIRILTRRRDGEGIIARDLTLNIRVFGDFSAAFLEGDNSTTLPTDAMRNHALAVAAEFPSAEPEDVAAKTLARLLESITVADSAAASVTIHSWDQLASIDAFAAAGWVGQAEIRADRNETVTTGGFGGLTLLRPFGSDFAGFYRDDMTDQPDAIDRVLTGVLDVTWRYRTPVAGYGAVRDRVRSAMTRVFGAEPSPAIQRTVYLMGTAALEVAPELDDVTVVFTGEPYGPPTSPGVLSDAIWSGTYGPKGVTEATVRRVGGDRG